MRIKNEMETAVKSEVGRVRDGHSGGGFLSRIPVESIGRALDLFQSRFGKTKISCRCPLCAADIMALALSTLPPCYCRSDHYGLGLEKVRADEIQRRVKAALHRVAMRPLHPPRHAVPEGSKIRLVDFGLQEGGRMIGPLLQRLNGTCSCESCREDTLAFGLNRFEPKYGLSIEGKLRIPPHQLDFIRHELLKILDEAASTIARNPRHGGKEDF